MSAMGTFMPMLQTGCTGLGCFAVCVGIKPLVTTDPKSRRISAYLNRQINLIVTIMSVHLNFITSKDIKKLPNATITIHYFDIKGLVSKWSLSGQKGFLALTDLLVFTDDATVAIN
jgi:hypothetical protein